MNNRTIHHFTQCLVRNWCIAAAWDRHFHASESTPYGLTRMSFETGWFMGSDGFSIFNLYPEWYPQNSRCWTGWEMLRDRLLTYQSWMFGNATAERHLLGSRTWRALENCGPVAFPFFCLSSEQAEHHSKRITWRAPQPHTHWVWQA